MNIRPAATLVLTKDAPEGLQVLLLQRTWEAVFMPGFFVFPGGSVDDQDIRGRQHAVGRGDSEISQTMSLDEGGGDYMLAAVRECFEEAGILVALDQNDRELATEHPVHSDRITITRPNTLSHLPQTQERFHNVHDVHQRQAGVSVVAKVGSGPGLKKALAISAL